MAKKIDHSKEFKKLDDIDHVLLRPGMYIGSIKPHTDEVYFLNDGKFDLEEVTYNPGLLKLFDEIISNSVDEHKRNSVLNKIDVTVDRDSGYITVLDNGGIPVVKHTEHKEWIPEMIFSNLRAGRNFNDEEDRVVAGTNGVGSTLTNIFSVNFDVETADSKKKFTQSFSNNMRKNKNPKVVGCKKHYTKIGFLPDYNRFGLDGLDEATFKMIRKRIVDIAACNSNLKLTLNGEKIEFKNFKDYISVYDSDVFYEESENWQIGLGVSEKGFSHISYVNSVETKDGGTHVDYIMSQVIAWLRNKIQQKHKVDVKPADLRRHIRIFINSTVVNSSFSSQTKEKLITESKDFGTEHIISNKIMMLVYKSEVTQQILDWVDKKKLAEERAELRKLNKGLDKKKVLKLIDAQAKTNRERCILGIFEGDSAASSIRSLRNAQIFGAFPLRGKFKNVRDIKNAEVAKNEEVKNLMAALGLKLGEEPKNLRYGKIYIYTDADTDGDCIAALLMNFFGKYWPELYEQGRIFKVLTPLVVVKKGKTINSFYTNDEYNKWLGKIKDPSKWEIEYKKGLASLEDFSYDDIINKPKLVQIVKDSNFTESLDMWFSKATDCKVERKKIILEQ